jgi:hypothetical protein
MKAALEKELSALTLEEKNEVLNYLAPYAIPDEDDSISSELMEELNKRLVSHRSDPAGSITLEQFKNREFGIL